MSGIVCISLKPILFKKSAEFYWSAEVDIEKAPHFWHACLLEDIEDSKLALTWKYCTGLSEGGDVTSPSTGWSLEAVMGCLGVLQS